MANAQIVTSAMESGNGRQLMSATATGRGASANISLQKSTAMARAPCDAQYDAHRPVPAAASTTHAPRSEGNSGVIVRCSNVSMGLGMRS